MIGYEVLSTLGLVGNTTGSAQRLFSRRDKEKEGKQILNF